MSPARQQMIDLETLQNRIDGLAHEPPAGTGKAMRAPPLGKAIRLAD